MTILRTVFESVGTGLKDLGTKAIKSRTAKATIIALTLGTGYAADRAIRFQDSDDLALTSNESITLCSTATDGLQVDDYREVHDLCVDVLEGKGIYNPINSPFSESKPNSGCETLGNNIRNAITDDKVGELDRLLSSDDLRAVSNLMEACEKRIANPL